MVAQFRVSMNELAMWLYAGWPISRRMFLCVVDGMYSVGICGLGKTKWRLSLLSSCLMSSYAVERKVYRGNVLQLRIEGTFVRFDKVKTVYVMPSGAVDSSTRLQDKARKPEYMEIERFRSTARSV